MLRFGKGKVKELGARPVSFPDQAVSHAARRFVVVAGPAAIEVNLNFPLWFRGNAVEQIIPICECARKTGYLAEDLWQLPSDIKSSNAAERRPPGGGIRWASVGAIFSIDQRFESFDKKSTVVLITGHGVFIHSSDREEEFRQR